MACTLLFRWGEERGQGCGWAGDSLRPVTLGVVKLPDGSIACRFYQNNSCNDQKAAHCARASGIHKHLCTFLKRDGTVCAARHSKMDHK